MTPSPLILIEAGASQPAAIDPSVLDSLDRVLVRQEHDAAATFQLIFNADETQALEDELPLIAGGAFASGNRVRIGLKIGATECWLIDGVATYEELLYGEAAGSFTYAITGEDLSAFMRLEEKAVEWPGRSAAQIVREILANYQSYGLQTSVIAPQNDVTPEADLWIRQQNTNDLSYLRHLGKPYGYIFALRCGATTSAQTTAYWGPPPRTSSSLPALRLGAGTSADVTSISFAYDGTAAELFSGGSRQDTTDDAALTVTSSTDWPLSKLAKTASIAAPLARKRRFIEPQTVGALATSSVDGFMQRSARAAARADANIDGLEYGEIVVPGSLLEVRGAGASHDGNYYIEAVEHALRRGSYRQRITLTREGLGSTLAGNS